MESDIQNTQVASARRCPVRRWQGSDLLSRSPCVSARTPDWHVGRAGKKGKFVGLRRWPSLISTLAEEIRKVMVTLQ